MEVLTGKPNHDVLDYLLRRRSAKADELMEPGPSGMQVEQLLSAALRVPDHGKMCPWYSLVFSGDTRAQAGEVLAQAYLKSHPNTHADKLALERGRFLRAPLVIALVSRVRKGKKPVWEQILSGGAAGMNLSLAAHALGFGVQWMSEWYAFDPYVRAEFGLDERDNVIGFFYIGTVDGVQPERDRPDLSEVVTHWQPGASVNKGDCYDVEKLGFPDAAFDFGFLQKS